MSRRIALIPEELVSSYQLQKPELRLEDNIDLMLEKANIPDDQKIKLLSQLITRYHKTVHEPPEPVRVSVNDETPQNAQMSDEEDRKFTQDPILQGIMATVSQRYSKYIPLIIEKLKTRDYSWNDKGEFVRNNQPVHGSSVIDFFNYVMRNVRAAKPPRHFFHFIKALKEINVPHSWIANQSLLSHMNVLKLSQEASESQDSEEEEDVFRRSITRDLKNRRKEECFARLQRLRSSETSVPKQKFK